MRADDPQKDERPGILIVDADVVVRHVLAEYLRGCGYLVAEAVSADEALDILAHQAERMETVLIDMDAPGSLTGFSFVRHLRTTYPDLTVMTAASPDRAADQASDLCEDGPMLARPYHPQQVMDEIRRLIAQRERSR